MNKNRGKGIVYATVAVAALFVAVVSGTFAYFTASATNSSTVTGTIANVGITLSVEKLTTTVPTNGDALIPLEVDDTQNSLLSTAIDSNNNCIDSNGYKVCQKYKITVTPGNTVLATGTLNIAATNAPNVKWQLLATATTTKAGAATVGRGTNGYLTASTGDTIPTEGKIYYVVVWVENQTTAQTDYGNFTGTVTFTGNGASAGEVKAQFSS